MPKYRVKEFAQMFREENPEIQELATDDSQVMNYIAKNSPELMEYVDREDLTNVMREERKKQISKERQKTFKSLSGVSRFGTGVEHGILDTFMGIKQLLSPKPGEAYQGMGYNIPGQEPTIATGAEDEAYKRYKGEYEDMSQGDFMAGAGEFAGSMLPLAAVPGGVGVKAGVGMGGLMGGAEYVDEDETRLKNTIYGSLFGAGGALLGKLGGKAFNALKNRYKDAPTKELVELAKTHGVDLSLGDVTQSNLLKRAEVLSENVPMTGMGSFREKGAEKVGKSAQSMVEKAKKEMLETGEEMGDDWTRIIQKSGKGIAQNKRKEATKLYNEVEELAKGSQVPTTNTLEKVQGALDDAGILEDNNVLNTLGKIEKGLEGEMSFSDLRKLRSKLGAKAEDLALSNRDASRQLREIKKAVESDLNEYATQSGGELKEAWKKADDYYKNEVVPLKDKMLAKAVKTDEPDQIYKKFIQRGAGDRATKFYNALDEKGQSAVRYGLLVDAYEKASKDGVFSPKRFTSRLKDLKDPKNVFFRGEKGKELEGFENLMEHAERFGQFAENPPTGNRIAQMLGAASWTTLGIPSTAIGVRLLSTKPMKRLLLAASDIEPGSNAMAELIQKNLPKISTLTAQEVEE